MSHPQRKTLDRLKKIGKPLFIDEVGTTAVRYKKEYNQQTSQAVFAKETARKDERLDSLRTFLEKEQTIV